MNESDLDKQFQHASEQGIDPEVKARAMRKAILEFNQAQQRSSVSTDTDKTITPSQSDQGFSWWHRLIATFSDKRRGAGMSEATNSGASKSRYRMGLATMMAGTSMAGLAVMTYVVLGWQSDTAGVGGIADIGGISNLSVDDSERLIADNTTISNPVDFTQYDLGVVQRQVELEKAEMVIETRQPKQPQLKALPERLGTPEALAPPVLSSTTKFKSLAENESLSTRAMDSMGQVTTQKRAPFEHNVPRDNRQQGRDRFEKIEDNPVKVVSEAPISTFSVDVDTASYSYVRGLLNRGALPQKDSVRLEELINYFNYDYPLPSSVKQPFKPSISVIDSPWKPGNQLVHIGIKGFAEPAETQLRSNLVFLLDVSGSMNNQDKLPLVKQSMQLLLSQLHADDTIAIVVYAGAAGVVLEPTPVSEKQKILSALSRLNAGGSTAGGEGIRLAYQLAEANFDGDAVNRIVLATDGDFNVGIHNRDELKGFVERKRDKGIFLSVLGFGRGNYHDHMMQVLAQNGNGVAAYIDTLSEAQKVLVDEATSMLYTIAKDVKIQVEFNPRAVKEYRLLGYETRALSREDFNNDAVDAGDIGAGHTVTAIYEITPVGASSHLVEDSRYQPLVLPRVDTIEPSASVNELGFVKVRYKLPNSNQSQLISQAIPLSANSASTVKFEQGVDSQFATAVAGFAQLLRGGQYTGDWNYDDAIELAQRSKGADEYGYRTEFIQLIRKAKLIESL